MVQITLDLIRKKTEHHDGLLDDLEEITLHQLNIEKIDVIGRVCPKLKILYLQNNLIGKIENIRRLSSLQYLNLALNNITSIPAEISYCEKLRKLDLTINFIDLDALESSIHALSELVHLDELYLTGNPCASWAKGYRSYVIHLLPKLDKLDGTDVTRGERLQAKGVFEEVQKELRVLAEEKRKEKEEKRKEKEALEGGEEKTDDTSDSSAQRTSAYTPESRIEMHREAEEQERKKEEDKKKSKKGDQPDDLWKDAQKKLNEKISLSSLTSTDELPKQRNLGKWDFTLTETPSGSHYVVDITLARFLDTSLIDLDIHPGWFQMLVKGKLLVLHWPSQVSASNPDMKRMPDGHLVVKVEKVRGVSVKEKAKGKEKEEEKEQEDVDDEETDDITSASTTSAPVLDLSSKRCGTKSSSTTTVNSSITTSSSATSTTSAFQTHRGTTLNSVCSDYRHITKSKSAAASASAAAGAQMREVAVTRSDALEKERSEKQVQQEMERKMRKTSEEERLELERLGLDDTGVPDLE